MTNLLLYLIFTVLGLILIKLGGNDFFIQAAQLKVELKFSLISILGFASYAVSFLIYAFFVIPKYELSYITPLAFGITQILIFIAALFIFHENITLYRILGILTILVGVILLNIKN